MSLFMRAAWREGWLRGISAWVDEDDGSPRSAADLRRMIKDLSRSMDANMPDYEQSGILGEVAGLRAALGSEVHMLSLEEEESQERRRMIP